MEAGRKHNHLDAIYLGSLLTARSEWAQRVSEDSGLIRKTTT